MNTVELARHSAAITAALKGHAAGEPREVAE
jgi:hypothetical protein